MIRIRDVIWFMIGAIAAVAILTLVIYRTNSVQAHVCESNLKVRTPLEAYIASTIPLYKTSRKLQAAEAKLQPKPSPQLAALEDQLRSLQDENFRQLVGLKVALTQAVVTGCPS